MWSPVGDLSVWVTASYPGKEQPFVAAGVVQLTDLGVFAQWFPDGGSVRVNRIADGSPRPGAQVGVSPSQADADTKANPTACATGTTGASGVAAFAQAAFARCAATD